MLGILLLVGWKPQWSEPWRWSKKFGRRKNLRTTRLVRPHHSDHQQIPEQLTPDLCEVHLNRIDFVHKQMKMWMKGVSHCKSWLCPMGYHEWHWLLENLSHLLPCLGILPQSSRVGTLRPHTCHRADPLHWRKSGVLSTGCSLTCRDGAVSRVVVKSVKVLAALWTEIERTWNTKEESHKDSGHKGARGGQRTEGDTHLWDVSETCPSSLDLEEQSLRGVRNRITWTEHLWSVVVRWMWRKFWELHYPHYNALNKTGEHLVVACGGLVGNMKLGASFEVLND